MTSPRRSTAATFNGMPASSFASSDTLTVKHQEVEAPLQFCVHDATHCALVWRSLWEGLTLSDGAA